MKRILTVLIVSLTLLACKTTIEEIIDAASTDRPVGTSAKEILSSSKYTSLKVEIYYMTGFAPDPAAVSHLQNFLNTHLNKPAGITVTTKEIAGSPSTSLSVNDVISIEENFRTGSSGGNESNIFLLYTNGDYATNSNVLGIAYRNTSAALFGKKIRDNSGGLGQVSRTKLEATVLEHEIGHLLGLVNLGSDMQTSHQANGHHCDNQSCLMYYASETTDVLGVLLTGNIPALDQNCINDLKANGGK